MSLFLHFYFATVKPYLKARGYGNTCSSFILTKVDRFSFEAEDCEWCEDYSKDWLE